MFGAKKIQKKKNKKNKTKTKTALEITNIEPQKAIKMINISKITFGIWYGGIHITLAFRFLGM